MESSLAKMSKDEVATWMDEFLLDSTTPNAQRGSEIVRELLDTLQSLHKETHVQHSAMFIQGKAFGHDCLLLAAESDAGAQAAMSTFLEKKPDMANFPRTKVIWIDPSQD